MTVIPCKQNDELRRKIEDFSEVLKNKSHLLGNHGLSEAEFYNSGLFRGAIERIRGEFSATMQEKRSFVRHILDHLQSKDFIRNWASSGESNRHDYTVTLNSGRMAVIELKGCLDGNNTTIFERPPQAHEFIIWGVCTNPSSDPQLNAWSGIHTRLSAEIIARKQRIDGVIIWDMMCGSISRLCPKQASHYTTIGPYRLPPPCLYLFPSTIPHPRGNPHPTAQSLQDVEILSAFNACFQCRPEEIFYVDFEIRHQGEDTLRTTRVRRDGLVQKESKPTAIRRV
ncbi:VRR-NUC domain-containing protein [Azospirillaceae bacterium]